MAGFAALRLWSLRWFGVVSSGFGRLSSRWNEGTLLTRRALLWRLWGSLVTIAVTFLVLECLLFILSAVDGWLAFMRPWEAIFSVAWHLGLAIAEGCVLGTLATLLALPVLTIEANLPRAQWIQGIIGAVLVIGFLIFGVSFLGEIFRWMLALGFERVSHGERLIIVAVFISAIGVAAIFRHSRKICCDHSTLHLMAQSYAVLC